MTKPLRDLTRRFILFTVGSWALAPIVGYGIALHYGMVEAKSFFQPELGLLLIPYLVLLSWVGLHFSRFLKPVQKWFRQNPGGGQLPSVLVQHIQGFSGNYWSFHLLAIFLLPTAQHWIGLYAAGTNPIDSLLNIMLLQLVIAIMAGMPGFLVALSTLGKLGIYTGTALQQFSMKTKLMIVGGYIPLLATTIMLKYY